MQHRAARRVRFWLGCRAVGRGALFGTEGGSWSRRLRGRFLPMLPVVRSRMGSPPVCRPCHQEMQLDLLCVSILYNLCGGRH